MTGRRMKTTAPPRPDPPTRKEWEFFGTTDELRANDPPSYLCPEPSAFNGAVRVIRYRMTIERIDEPVEEVRDRLRRMWRRHTNHHLVAPLKAMGQRLGIDLRGEELGKGGER